MKYGLHVEYHDTLPLLPPRHGMVAVAVYERTNPMATVSKDFADKLVAKDGYYADDPWVIRIVEYTNAFGSGLSYGIEYEGQFSKYCESQYVRNPRVYWEAD